MALKAGGGGGGARRGGRDRAPAAPGRLGLAVLAALPAAGFLAPDAWLRRRPARGARAIENELADVLDLLRVAVAAGLAPKRALAEVGRRHHGVLAAELRRAAARNALGVPMAAGARRAGAPRRAGAAQLIAALRRAERHGAPLGARARRAGRRGARRPRPAADRRRPPAPAPQIQLAVALLLVPAVLLLVAAALLPALTGGD